MMMIVLMGISLIIASLPQPPTYQNVNLDGVRQAGYAMGILSLAFLAVMLFILIAIGIAVISAARRITQPGNG